MPFGYWLLSSSDCTRRPFSVVVLAIRLTMTSWLINGRPLQFSVMWQNIRCSILFHLLVPGGKWQTAIRSPISFDSFCSSTFHSRTRAPLLALKSRTISSSAFSTAGSVVSIEYSGPRNSDQAIS